jgi:hypothetical protein
MKILVTVIFLSLCIYGLTSCIGLPGADNVDEGKKVYDELKKRITLPQYTIKGDVGFYFRPHPNYIEFIIIGSFLKAGERARLAKILHEIQSEQRGKPIKVFFYYHKEKADDRFDAITIEREISFRSRRELRRAPQSLSLRSGDARVSYD